VPCEVGPLVTALVFAAVFLFGSSVLIPGPIRRHKRKVLSFGAGVTIAYVFVHLLPGRKSWGKGSGVRRCGQWGEGHRRAATPG